MLTWEQDHYIRHVPCLLYRSTDVFIVNRMNTYLWVLPEVRVAVNRIDVYLNGGSLWHEIAGDVCVLIELSSYDTHWREESKALLDAVLEVNKMLHVIAVCGGDG